MITLLDAFHWSQLLQPQYYIENGGLWLLLFVVFAETGLFFGFFLPGDSLLFVAGIYSAPLAAQIFASENEWLNLFIIFSFISVAGILGNYVGYQIGNKVGPAMYDWKENLFFKKKYLSQAQDFYEKHGGRAIVIARFIPIVRTFAPIVAGIVKMDKSKFTYFNIVGCLAWVASMLCAGHFLQSYIYNHFQFDLKKHLEIIVLVIVFVTTAPVIFQVIKHRTKK
ncbi:MAG: DedA family protein [Chitinophagia bacterium]|nr:DedA family protein [Chitinophagia bacterium]NCA29605.1 DedA family protein [Chitinophagia bacterium]NDD16963.1 DedA family protein [Chitinophagia bacterium]